MTFSRPIEDRYFEDYEPGSVHEFGSITIEESEIVAFAEKYDPQPFHVDPTAAKESVFGGLIASGWQTASLAMRILVDNYISRVASLGSPGVDEIRWLKPVRPGNTLSLRVTLMEAQRSRSKPEQGYIRALTEVLNEDREVVMSMKSGGFIKCRQPELEHVDL
jgi:acyl dehydratase